MNKTLVAANDNSGIAALAGIIICDAETAGSADK